LDGVENGNSTPMDTTESDLLAGDPHTTIINAGKSPGRREIRGAIRYDPKELLEADHLALPIAHEDRVILYAEHGHDDTLQRIADRMRADGFEDVHVYEGTLQAYEQAGGQTQEPSMQQIIPPSNA
jgi:rhodanese-related sulfurtransferase